MLRGARIYRYLLLQRKRKGGCGGRGPVGAVGPDDILLTSRISHHAITDQSITRCVCRVVCGFCVVDVLTMTPCPWGRAVGARLWPSARTPQCVTLCLYFVACGPGRVWVATKVLREKVPAR